MGHLMYLTAPAFGMFIAIGGIAMIVWVWERGGWNVFLRLVLMLVLGAYLAPAALGYVQFAPTGVGILNNIAGTVGIAEIMRRFYPRIRGNPWGRYGAPLLAVALLGLIWQGTITKVMSGSTPWPSLSVPSSFTAITPTSSGSTSGQKIIERQCLAGDRSKTDCDRLRAQGKIR